MANLISPGVSVTISDESFYIPAESATVPLIFIATAEDKLQTDGATVAIGTAEHNVVRTLTSVTQSLQLYGVPRFLRSQQGDPHHGDCRNEYGLLALNQYLGLGNRAYVVRANVNLNTDGIADKFEEAITDVQPNIEAAVDAYIDSFNLVNGYVTGDAGFKVTVNATEADAIARAELAPIFLKSNFASAIFKTDFYEPSVEPDVYTDETFTVKEAYTYPGLSVRITAWATDEEGATVGLEDEFTAEELSDLVLDSAQMYINTLLFNSHSSLGADDAARRAAIVTALQASINNPQMSAEGFEYNVIVCPGYHETADELVALATNIEKEAIVIGDVPMNMDAEELVTWAESSSGGRATNDIIAYYYSHGLTSNIDGNNVLGSSSGVQLRTIAYSDNVSQVWFAPAGAQRGVVTGVSQMGYCSGTLGQPTVFNEVLLNRGHRDNMYKSGTNVNPITFLPGRGIIVMGQKTSAPTTSALDRVNVIRLLAYIRRSLRKSTFAFVFEPNDQLTRDNLKAMVDGFLGSLVVGRGLYDFASLCDESNNTPDRIDRSELWIEIALKPVKAAEFIYIPIRVVTTGADI